MKHTPSLVLRRQKIPCGVQSANELILVVDLLIFLKFRELISTLLIWQMHIMP